MHIKIELVLNTLEYFQREKEIGGPMLLVFSVVKGTFHL